MISEFRPDVVGLSVMTGKYGAALNIARLAKRIGKSEGRDIKVIITDGIIFGQRSLS